MQRFKNGRKTHGKRPNDDNSVSSAAKAPRLEEDSDELCDEEYEKHVRDLKLEMKRANPRSNKVKELMDMTSARRRKWIERTKPSSVELVEIFPSLRVEKWVSFVEAVYCISLEGGGLHINSVCQLLLGDIHVE